MPLTLSLHAPHGSRLGKFGSAKFDSCLAIVGPPEECVERLLQLTALGLTRFVVVGPGFHAEAGSNRQTLFVLEDLHDLSIDKCGPRGSWRCKVKRQEWLQRSAWDVPLRGHAEAVRGSGSALRQITLYSFLNRGGNSK